MIVEALAGDALVVIAAECGVHGGVGDAGLLPEGDLAPPVILVADAGGEPNLQANRRGITALGADQPAQLVEGLQRLVVGRISERHEAVAVLGGAAERGVDMAAEPDRHAARLGARVDAAVVELVELALERDMRLGPRRLHEAHLLLGTLAAGVEVHAETLELDLVPAYADAQAKTAVAQDIEAGRLLGDQRRLALGQDQHT